jgi:peptidyl-prolyl cis-trans isomerase A (cyclophilin A)
MPTKHATFRTSMGDIRVRLLGDHAPETVENFVGLATGTKVWRDPRSGEERKDALYDGTIFHRVIPDFMIQGGDPMGTGMGGPGYKFGDETKGGPSFDKPGYLAMANSGPNTNGSQFFITEAATPWLNGKHTIFGEVVEGMDVVNAIAHVGRGANDRPKTDVRLERIEIEESA